MKRAFSLTILAVALTFSGLASARPEPTCTANFNFVNNGWLCQVKCEYATGSCLSDRPSATTNDQCQAEAKDACLPSANYLQEISDSEAMTESYDDEYPTFR